MKKNGDRNGKRANESGRGAKVAESMERLAEAYWLADDSERRLFDTMAEAVLARARRKAITRATDGDRHNGGQKELQGGKCGIR